MSFTNTIGRTVNLGNGIEIAQEKAAVGSSRKNVSESIGAGATDTAVAFTCDVSALKSLWISSDQDITIKTNSSSVPQETIALKANQPITWVDGDVQAKPFAGDVTAIYVSNAGAAAAALEIRSLEDATP